MLEGLWVEASTWQVPAVYDDGAMLFDATCSRGSRASSASAAGRRTRFDSRTPHWQKFAHRLSASFVVGGWRPQEGSSAGHLAAVLVGEPTADGLMYRGRVGSGIGGKASRLLTGLLADLARTESPFDDEVPRMDALGTHWVDPVVVIDVDSHATARNQRLRQPSYRGVRSDLTAGDL